MSPKSIILSIFILFWSIVGLKLIADKTNIYIPFLSSISQIDQFWGSAEKTVIETSKIEYVTKSKKYVWLNIPWSTQTNAKVVTDSKVKVKINQEPLDQNNYEAMINTTQAEGFLTIVIKFRDEVSGTVRLEIQYLENNSITVISDQFELN